MGGEGRPGPSTRYQPLQAFLSAILEHELGRIPTGRRSSRSRRRTPWRPYEPFVDPVTNPTEDEEDVSRVMLMLDGHLPLPMAPPPPRPPRAPQPPAAKNRKRRAETVTKKTTVNTKRARCNGTALASGSGRVAATAGGGLVNYLAGPMTTTTTATTALAEVQATGQGNGNNTGSTTTTSATTSTTQGTENNNSISNTIQDANAQNVTVYNWCLQSRPRQQKYQEPLPSSCKTQHAIQRSILPEDNSKGTASHQSVTGVFPPVWVPDPWSARSNLRSADGSRMVLVVPGGSNPQRKRSQLVSVPVPPGWQTAPMVFLPGVGALPSGTRQGPLQIENRQIINDKPKLCRTLAPSGRPSVQFINQGGRPRLRDAFYQNHQPISPQVAHASLGQYFEGRDVFNPNMLYPPGRSKLLSTAGFSHAQGQVTPRISLADFHQGISHVNHAGYRD